MTVVLKLVLFCLFIYSMGILFYRTYGLLNEKITGSRTLKGVVGYALLLILLNLLLFVGGLYLFLQLYSFLSLSA